MRKSLFFMSMTTMIISLHGYAQILPQPIVTVINNTKISFTCKVVETQGQWTGTYASITPGTNKYSPVGTPNQLDFLSLECTGNNQKVVFSTTYNVPPEGGVTLFCQGSGKVQCKSAADEKGNVTYTLF